MSRQEVLLINACLQTGTIKHAVVEGISSEYFGNYRQEWDWLTDQRGVPSRAVFRSHFPDFPRRKVKQDDLPIIIKDLKENYLFQRGAAILEKTSKEIRRKKKTAEEIISDLRTATHELLNKTIDGGVIDLVAESDVFYKQFRDKQKRVEKGGIAGISTGLQSIDDYTGGLLDGLLYMVIARQGNAKTYLMLYMLANAILDGKRVLWISREMPEDLVALRLHSIWSSLLRGPDNGFSNLALVLGREEVDHRDYRKFLRKLQKDLPGQVFMPRNRRVRIDQIESYIERFAPDLVFYDYLGIISGDESNRSWQQLGAEANLAKEIAMIHKVPIVMASQVNRAAAKEPDEAPMVENISFSDSIGYAADMVFSLHLGDGDDEDPFAPKPLEVWLRKARYGVKDISITYKFDGDRGHFEEIDSPRDYLLNLRRDDAKDDKNKTKGRTGDNERGTRTIRVKKRRKVAT